MRIRLHTISGIVNSCSTASLNVIDYWKNYIVIEFIGKMIRCFLVRNRAALKADFFQLRTTSLEASTVAESTPFGAENFCVHFHYSNKLTRSSNDMSTSKLKNAHMENKILNFSLKYYKKIQQGPSKKLKTVTPLNVFMLSSILSYGATYGKLIKRFFSCSVGIPLSDPINNRWFTPFQDFFYLLRACGFTLSTEIKHTYKYRPSTSFKKLQDMFMIIFNEITPIDEEEESAVSIHSKLLFRAIWRDPFDPNNTKLRKFYLGKDETQTINVSMMSRDGLYREGELDDLNARFIEIPLKHELGDYGISMFVIIMKKEYPNDEQIFLRTIISTMDLKMLYSSLAEPSLIRVILPKLSGELLWRQVDFGEFYENAKQSCRPSSWKLSSFPSDAGSFEKLFSQKMTMRTSMSVSAVIDETGIIDSGLGKKRTVARSRADVEAAPAAAAADPTPPVFRVDRPYVMTIIAKTIDSDPIPLLTMQITGDFFYSIDEFIVLNNEFLRRICYYATSIRYASAP
ncbi:uncharacterized protein [Venturia canescens]|uniref:uncharacterized protein n=1 Tax=Venturia canescens TaxID=32260 RepID=UPI001C9D1155|nr:uncharacterized protein LOC122417735 [Venturia canescens]